MTKVKTIYETSSRCPFFLLRRDSVDGFGEWSKIKARAKRKTPTHHRKKKRERERERENPPSH